MCGRTTNLLTWQEIHDTLNAIVPTEPMAPRYNLAPGQPLPVVRMDESNSRQASMLRWGLIPSWAKEAKIGYSLINARAETVAEKPSFRKAFKQRRCIVAISGFYEWQRLAGGKLKQPFYITHHDKLPIFFAGLWETWKQPDNNVIESVTIITTTPNKVMEPIHNRMPVILQSNDYGHWLSPEATADELHALLKPCADNFITSYKVSTLVNKPANDLPQCIEKLDDSSIDTQNSL